MSDPKRESSRADSLDGLLARKAAQPTGGEFRSVEAFKNDFFRKVARQSDGGRPWKRIFSLAAVVALACGAIVWQLYPVRSVQLPVSSDKVREAVKLFGNDAGVLFVNDELITGERLGNGAVSNTICLKLRDAASGKVIELAFAGGDEDSLTFESPQLSGAILLSRSDRKTLVLELDLQYGSSEEQIRDIIMLPKTSGVPGKSVTFQTTINLS